MTEKQHIRLTRARGGNPANAVITVSPGAAEYLINSGDAVPVSK